jgi:hypothetical protein
MGNKAEKETDVLEVSLWVTTARASSVYIAISNSV